MSEPVDKMYLPQTGTVQVQKFLKLRNGDNPHQEAAYYLSPHMPPPAIIQGKLLSYTNILDMDAALRIASSFAEPAAVVVKHTNPCGVAIAVSCSHAYRMARDADATSAFGGIVGLPLPS